MKYQNEEAFAKAWKDGVRHKAYLLWGSERYLIRRWREIIIGQGNTDAFNLHRFDGKKLDTDALYEAVQSPGLMSPLKVVRIDDLEWAKLSGDSQKNLNDILEDIPDGCVIISTPDSSDGLDPKSAGEKKLITLFDKAGCAVELGARSRSGQLDFIKGIAKKRACILSSDMGRKILDTCPTDMDTLYTETAKICAFAGSGDISGWHIEAIATPRVEAKVFDLQKKILIGDAAGAMKLIDNLFYLRESPVMILAVLIRSYVDLYRARIAKDSGKTLEEAAAVFGYKGREFALRNAFSDVSGLSVRDLRQSLRLLHDCDRDIKSASISDRVLLEKTVVGLIMSGSRRAG